MPAEAPQMPAPIHMGATPLPLPIKKVLLVVLKTGSANVRPLVLFGFTVPFLIDI